MIEYSSSNQKDVYALLDNTEEDVIDTVLKILDHHRPKFHQTLKNNYEGIAKCNPDEDKFSFELGKKIAKDRLLVKYYDDKCHDYLAYADFVSSVLEDVLKMYVKAFNTRAMYIQELESMGIEH